MTVNIEKFLSWFGLTVRKEMEKDMPFAFDPENPTAPTPPPTPPEVTLATDTTSSGKAVLTNTADAATTVLHAGATADTPAVVQATQATNDRVDALSNSVDEIKALLAKLAGEKAPVS